jgi:ribosomal protein L16/L10AE
LKDRLEVVVEVFLLLQNMSTNVVFCLAGKFLNKSRNALRRAIKKIPNQTKLNTAAYCANE